MVDENYFPLLLLLITEIVWFYQDELWLTLIEFSNDY